MSANYHPMIIHDPLITDHYPTFFISLLRHYRPLVYSSMAVVKVFAISSNSVTR